MTQDLAQNIAPVHMVRSIDGHFTGANPPERYLDCSARKVAVEHLYTATSDAAVGCATYQEGDKAPMAGPNTIATVKMETQDGPVWISEGDYAGFIAECNSCCNP